MKKSNVMKLFSLKRRGKGCIFTREIIGIFILSSLLQLTASASNFHSQTAKINLRMRNADLEEVIWMIKKQTEFDFFYNSEDVKNIRGINVNLKNASAEDVLRYCLNGTNLTYQIVHKAIILKKVEKTIRVIPKKAVIPKNNSIKGKVTKKGGQALTGVAVFVKGTTNGTITDINGNYNLANIIPNSTLVFSFIGTKKQEIKINGQTVINVTLEEENTGLEEIVVIAYGAQKKVAITGAINTVGSKEIMQSSSASLANALAGRLSGLTALQSGGGQPGVDDATLYLRGIATLNGSSPLIMIDGVPRDNNNIRTLDANEVESVSILKDASATAVFGVRGANGVILITTKRGQEGKAKLDVNVAQSFTSFTREPTQIGSVDYLHMRNQAFTNDGMSAPYSDAIIAKYKNPLSGLDPTSADYAAQAKIRGYMYPTHNYYRELIRKYTPQTRVSVDVSGGTKQVSYFINASYLHQGGNLNTESKSLLGYNPSSYMDRFTFRSNLDYKISNSLSLFLNLGNYIEQVNMPPFAFKGTYSSMMSDIFYRAQSVLPITPGPTTIAGLNGVAPGQLVDPNFMSYTAFEEINRRGYRNYSRSNLNSSLGMVWDLSKSVTPGLNIKGMISYDSYAGSALEGDKAEKLYAANIDYATDQMTYTLSRATETPLSISKYAATDYNIDLQGSANYNRKFGKNEVGGMIMATRDYWEAAGGTSDYLIPYNLLGLCARATYAYDNRYFGEFDMGYNGSEQFAPSNRYGFFPAFSAGWVLTNESFLKDNSVLTNLKFRASYGKVGNDKMGSNRFLYLDDTEVSSGGLFTSLGNGKYISEGLRGNNALAWESSWKRNGGIDFQLFKELSGSFDYFIEHRSGILISRTAVPVYQGVILSNIPLENLGIVHNHGYEVELTYNKAITKDLSFMIKGNYSYNHNKLIYADQVSRGSSYAVEYPTDGAYTTGYSIGQCFGYQIDWKDHGGYWISSDEIKTSKLTYSFGTPRAGDFKYIDQNGDGVINEKDQVPISYSSIPRVNYGITFAANYKAFDFTIFFQGVGKYSSVYSGKGVYETVDQGTYYDYQKNAWTADRYIRGQEITYPALSTSTNTSQVANDFFIMSRAFTRLKNLELGYTLPQATLKTLGISKFRFAVGGQNLYLWDHLKMNHVDSEATDPTGYPVPKMVNFSLNITF